MARAAPQSQPYNRSNSTPSSRSNSRAPEFPGRISSSGGSHQTKSATNRNNNNAASRGRKIDQLTSNSILPSLLMVPLVMLHFLYSIIKGIIKLPFGYFFSKKKKSSREAGESSRGDDGTIIDDDPEEDDDDDADADAKNELLSKLQRNSESSSSDGNEEDDDDDDDEGRYLSVPASPALTTLLDDALYRAYQGELVPTVAAASRLLTEFIEVKEAAALVWRECRWTAGVPLSGGLEVVRLEGDGANAREVAIGGAGGNGVFLGGGVVLDGLTGNSYCFDAAGGGNRGGRRGSSGSGSGNESSSALNVSSTSSNFSGGAERLHLEEMSRWNEFDTIQDFARQCYIGANEAIQRLTTDRLAETANLSLQDSLKASTGTKKTEQQGGQNGKGGDIALQQPQSQTNDTTGQSTTSPPSPTLPSSSSSTSTSSSATNFLPSSHNPADAGIGRCYNPQPRRDCWESPRLYCPDYYWADDAIGGCQRLLKTLLKHRFLSLVATNGWDRYCPNDGDDATHDAGRENRSDGRRASLLPPPVHASASPHAFPSLEAAHALRHLADRLLPRSVPARLNQLRAAAESNAAVSKRLYLVKCEYRAPMRALWESYGSLRAAPRAGLVERYLREYHGVNVARKRRSKVGKEKGEDGVAVGGGGSSNGEGGGGGSTGSGGGSATKSGAGSLRRKSSTEVGKKSAIQHQREKLEKLITEKYWKHPSFVEALQLERSCERMEIEMSQMLLPLSNLANEIMNEWKGRLRAVAVIHDYPVRGDDEEENKEEDDEDEDDNESLDDQVHILLGWQNVPYMRELLRRLKSILRRKPDPNESTGIRPLLLDLQGVPRHKRDSIDSSIEMPFYPPPSKPSLFERFTSSATSEKKKPDEKNSLFSSSSSDHHDDDASGQWFHLEQFLSQVRKLIKLLALPNIPFLVEEHRLMGSKGSSREYNKNTLLDIIEQCKEVWDEEMFRAQYKDWFDMVKRQQELNAGGADGGGGAAAAPSDNNNDSTVQHESLPSSSSLSELSETIREAEIELSIAMASKDQLERVYKRLEALREDKVARYKVLAHIVFDVGYRELNDGIVVEPPDTEADEDDNAKNNTVVFPRLSNVVPGVFGDQLAMSGEELPVG